MYFLLMADYFRDLAQISFNLFKKPIKLFLNIEKMSEMQNGVVVVVGWPLVVGCVAVVVVG